MGRYIDADKFHEWVYPNWSYCAQNDDDFHDAIDAQPTADVAPVAHAHWEKHFKRPGVYEDLYWHCTNCNSKTLEEYAPYWWLYCPHCGAKMDEESE